MFYKIMKLSKIRALSILLIILIMLFTGCVSSTAIKQADQEQADQEVAKSLNLITDISTAEGSESLSVLIKAERLLTYTSVKQPMPLSVALYFPETALGEIETALALDSDIVASIKASELTENGHTSKIEIALKKDASYEVFREGNGLQISFAKGSKITASAEINMPAATSPEEDKDKKAAWVNRVDFSSEDAGKSTIIIGTTRPVKYKINKAAEKRLRLILFNTNLPDYRKRQMITTRFNSAVDRITPMQTPALKTSSMIVIELRESVPYYIEQANNLLLVHFEASSIPPEQLKEADLPSWKKVIAQTTALGEEIEDKKAEDKVLRPKVARKYIGAKIALDFYDTDIKNVFLILMEVSGKNFAIDKDVTGKVTLTLAKPVPWDQALDLILKMNQLGQTSEGDIIRIATLETLKKEKDFEQAEIIAAQKTKKEQKTLEPLVTEYIPVNYANAAENILPHLEKIISKDRGSAAVDEGDKSTETASGGASVSADKRTNMIIMTDIAEKIEQAREIVKQLDKVTPQVMIEARIVEASDKFSREIGVDWTAGTGTTKGTLEKNRLSPHKGIGYGAAVNFPFSLLKSSDAARIGFGFVGSQFVLDAAILAYETQGDVKVISSPKILTLDNVEATVSQGVDYPQLVMDQETKLYSMTEKKLRLELKVTPHVTSDNRISMKIFIKKYDIGTLYEAGRSFDTKEASTELLVDDGNTIVIGGIMKTTKHTYEGGVPWLSKISVLGWLFKTEYKKDNKEELLIFITPKIVQLEQQDL